MADVIETPKVRCDNCGAIAEKSRPHSESLYKRPRTWGDVRVSPTNYGSAYPDGIHMVDLCPRCLKAVHDAVGTALKTCREDPR